MVKKSKKKAEAKSKDPHNKNNEHFMEGKQLQKENIK
jgi:hypothetical protein